MAQVEEAVVDLLQGSTALEGLIGENNVHHMILPQKDLSLPAVTYRLVSRTPEHLMGADSAVTHKRIEVNAYDSRGSGTSDVKSVANECKNVLSRHSSTSGVVVIQDIFFDNELDLFEEDAKNYRVQQDYIVHYEEST